MSAKNNYYNTKIYKLEHVDTGFFYIGSTTQQLCKKFVDHKRDAIVKLTPAYKKFNELGWEGVRIILIENVKCENKEEKLKKENEYISQHRGNVLFLNCRMSYQTKDELREHKKQYRKANLEKLLARNKSYYQETKEIKKLYQKSNRDKILENQRKRNKESIKCPCGGNYTHDSQKVHQRSKRHIAYAKLLQNTK